MLSKLTWQLSISTSLTLGLASGQAQTAPASPRPTTSAQGILLLSIVSHENAQKELKFSEDQKARAMKIKPAQPLQVRPDLTPAETAKLRESTKALVQETEDFIKSLNAEQQKR